MKILFLNFILGAILGLCIVAGLIGLFICIQQRRRKGKSKNGSTDKLKSSPNGNNQIENFHATPVRVVDTNSCLYYPTQTGIINEGIKINLFLFRNNNLSFFSSIKRNIIL
jgi:hypothetical protein